MNKQISLENIFLAVRLNCPVDPLAEKPLLLVKSTGPVKNKGVGRLLFIYFAMKAGHPTWNIKEHIQMSVEEWDGKITRINKLLQKGKERFYQDPNGPEDVNLFFYRKFLLVQSYLRFNHRFELETELIDQF